MAVTNVHVLNVGDVSYNLFNVSHWSYPAGTSGATVRIAMVGQDAAQVEIARTTFETAMTAHLLALDD
jgi:hypothetical protein